MDSELRKKTVAIIGSGPAGVIAAGDLFNDEFDVTILEKVGTLVRCEDNQNSTNIQDLGRSSHFRRSILPSRRHRCQHPYADVLWKVLRQPVSSSELSGYQNTSPSISLCMDGRLSTVL